MSRLLSDHSKFAKIELNHKHEFIQEVRDLLDMELEVKSCLDNVLDVNYISAEDYNLIKP